MLEIARGLLFVGAGLLVLLMLPVALIISTPVVMIWPKRDVDKSWWQVVKLRYWQIIKAHGVVVNIFNAATM